MITVKIFYLSICLSLWWGLGTSSDVEEIFKGMEVVPDALKESPQEMLKVVYPDDVIVVGGKELTPTATKDEPQISWNADPKAFYALIMSNIDAPTRSNPVWREWLHWLVVNIPGMDVGKGEVFAPYLGPLPPKESGKMRYMFVVYKQPGKLTFNDPKVNNTSIAGHAKFLTMKFADKYGLEQPPVAGNVFETEYDDYVPVLFKQMNIVV